MRSREPGEDIRARPAARRAATGTFVPGGDLPRRTYNRPRARRPLPPFRRPPALVAALLLVLLAAPAAARERDDIVLLVRGDRVTGEIIRLEAANLSVRTRAMGTVDIDWPDVVGLVSVQYFEVERVDGARLRGRLDTAESGGALVVRTGPEDEPVVVPLVEVAGIDQIGSNIWRGRRGHVDLGWNYSQADADTTFSLDAELALKVSRFRWVTTLTANLSDGADGEASRRDDLQSLLEVPTSRRTLLLAWLKHERNDDLDLEARDTAAGGFGWLPVSGPRGRIVVGPGVAESREEYFSSPGSETVTSALLFARFDYYRFGRFGTKASFSATWLPVLTGPDRDRIEVRAYLRQKLGSDFTVALSPYYSYDSRPPTATAPGEDWGWVTGLGWQF